MRKKNISQILTGRPTAMLPWLLLNINIEKRMVDDLL